MKTLQKRVFAQCWTLATTAYAFIRVSRANFKNWWWKQFKNAFFRHVEHLRLLHMPLFAFLEQISKIDDENSAKTRFSACWTFATAAYAFSAFLKQYSRINDENSAKTLFSACWTLATTADACICVSKSVFTDWWWKHCKNAFWRNVEHLRLLHMPLFAFLEQISKIVDENNEKTRFSAWWTFATAAYAFICVSRAVFKN